MAEYAVKVRFCGEGMTGRGALGVILEVNLGFGNFRRMDVECAEWREGGCGQRRVQGIDVTICYPLSKSFLDRWAGLPPLGQPAREAGKHKRARYRVYTEGRQDHRFTPATMEAYGRLGEDTRMLAEDMARSNYVKGQWADARGLEASAAIGMFKARIMQAVSVRLM